MEDAHERPGEASAAGYDDSNGGGSEQGAVSGHRPLSRKYGIIAQ